MGPQTSDDISLSFDFFICEIRTIPTSWGHCEFKEKIDMEAIGQLLAYGR